MASYPELGLTTIARSHASPPSSPASPPRPPACPGISAARAPRFVRLGLRSASIGGKFILRVEDTDQRRSSKDSAAGILRDLKWIGIDWDEGPQAAEGDLGGYDHQVGASGPYFQSQRLDIYNKHVSRPLLQSTGVAYEDQGAVRLRMGKDITHDDAVFGTITVPGKDLEDFVIRKADGFPTFHMAVVVDDALMWRRPMCCAGRSICPTRPSMRRCSMRWRK